MLVEIVCVRTTATYVIFGGVQRIEVLVCSDYGGKVVVVSVARKSGLDQLSRDRQRMVFSEVNLLGESSKDGRGDVEPMVSLDGVS